MLLYYIMKKKEISKILVIGGPTGIGKSKVAFEAAIRLDGEIISADSMQFYRETCIGTDKVSPEMRSRVVHHLVDCISLAENFDVSSFVRKAVSIAGQILEGGRVPVVAGGSGLYLRSLLRGVFTMPPVDEEKKRKARKILAEKSTTDLYFGLNSADPEAASRIHKNDRKRISRALEVFMLTGKPISFWHTVRPEDSILKAGIPVYFILTRKREVMYNKIDLRVEEMFRSGWIDEVRRLKEEGLEKALLHKAPIGYPEILDFLAGKCGLEELKETVKRKTRVYARKQLTWFRKEEGTWIEIEDEVKTAEKISRLFLEA